MSRLRLVHWRAAGRVLIALALCAATAETARAQPSTLSGRVVDAAGQAMGGVEIIARERRASAEVRAQSGADGSFTMGGMAPGEYVVEARGPAGLRTATRRVVLDAGAVARLELRLDRAAHEERVVVTAEARPQPLDEVGKSVAVIDGAEVERRDETAVPELLRRVAGVQIRTDGGPGQLSALRIRGLRADGAAVLIDGFRFRDTATPQGDAMPYFGNLQVINLDRVEVLRGSASSLYGTNAVGGVVNIVSRLAAARPGGEVEAAAGQLGETRVRAAHSGSVRAGVLGYSVGGLFADVADGVDGNDQARSGGVQGGLSARFGPASTLTARIWASDDRVDLNTSPSAFEVPAGNIGPGPVVEARPLPAPDVARLLAGEPVNFGTATLIPGVDDPDDERTSSFITTAVRFTHQMAAGPSLDLSYQKLHTERSFIARPGGVGFQPFAEGISDFVGVTDTLQAAATTTLGSRVLFTGGYEFEREGYEGLQREAVPGAIPVGTDVSQDAHALFARAGFDLGGRTHVASSVRVQAFRLATPRFLPAGTPSGYDGVAFDAPPAAVTADVAVAHRLGDRTRLRAHAGNAYRAPSLYERFGGGLFPDPATGTVAISLYGDPRLEPDRYVSFDAGIERDVRSGRLNATYFETWVRQLTEFQFGGPIDPATDPFGRDGGYLNGDGGRARGLELEHEWRARRVLLSSAYTLTSSRTDKALLAPGFHRAPSIARHTLAITGIVHVSDRLELVADLFTRSSMYAAMFTSLGSRAYEFPAAAKLDLGGAWTWRLPGARRLRVRATVDNVLDRTYYELGWLAPGATFRAGATFTY